MTANEKKGNRLKQLKTLHGPILCRHFFISVEDYGISFCDSFGDFPSVLYPSTILLSIVLGGRGGPLIPL